MVINGGVGFSTAGVFLGRPRPGLLAGGGAGAGGATAVAVGSAVGPVRGAGLSANRLLGGVFLTGLVFT